ncbi:hypothetical protein HK100_001161 [Physocladia obscura]|uniref:FAD-binding domain-containing protein n=1 Tax=Physocladia obscura TaxID=109957 RepID=A0AAD5SYZ2_9FUNG|nr:hypothetical protein HK100_001161 [Physocladia obscura]
MNRIISDIPKIAIIGGGPGGLTLGALLQKHSIPFIIYELRRKPTDEDLAKVSGSLDLHEGTGLAAIREIGIHDEFESLIGECAATMKIVDKDGNVLYDEAQDITYIERNRPEISRNNLTKLLVSQIPPDRIKWNHKLQGAERVETTNEIFLDFGPQGTAKHAFVIGADGAWSKVRSSLLTNYKPVYTGIYHATVTMTDVTVKNPDLAELVGPGSFFALGDRKGIISQRGVQDSVRLYLSVHTTETEPDGGKWATDAGFKGKTAAEAKSLFLSDELFGTWASSLKQLISVVCDHDITLDFGSNIDTRALYALPTDVRWETTVGVTAIGDAAHVMPPNGEGVNLAMKDALDLSNALADAFFTTNDLSDLKVEKFEIEMWERVKGEVDGTVQLNDLMFGENGGSYAMANWIREMIAAAAAGASGNN